MVLKMVMTVLTSTSHISHKRSKQYKHVVGNKDDDVDNGADIGVDNGDDDIVHDGVDGAQGADKHLTHLSQG
eukprot:3020574-Ditylum_brightwellii.AAC.1